jgi:hypothetical protein
VDFISRLIDERFLTHRQRSTSTAGITCGLTAILLFAYRYYIDGRWSWDLITVALAFIVVKLALMTWYYFTD